MRTIHRLAVFMALLAFGGGEARAATVPDALARAGKLTERGDFAGADKILGAALQTPGLPPADQKKLEWQQAVLKRIQYDYSLNTAQFENALQSQVKNVSQAEFNRWLAQGWFDCRNLDGQLRFWKAEPDNFFYRHPELQGRRIQPDDSVAEQKGRLADCRRIEAAARASGLPIVLPRRFDCTMTVTVNADAVPAGELIRCWLPLPRNYPYQTDFRLLGSSSPVLSLAPARSPIRSAYLEQRAVAGAPTEFEVSYRYTRWGVFYDPQPDAAPAADMTQADLAPFVREEPHVVFSAEIRKLARAIIGAETNPVRKAKSIYDWIANNIHYSVSREYSTIPNLSGYCLAHHYGDCGEEAMLFITLCRSESIPARWQSGWETFPGAKDMHDWAEIYLAPYGWVPVDPWAGIFATQYCNALSPDERRQLRDFFFGGMDYYRMAANGDHSQPLAPAKEALRSDDVDFQRGELEGGRHNIYFDKFIYNLSVHEEP